MGLEIEGNGKRIGVPPRGKIAIYEMKERGIVVLLDGWKTVDYDNGDGSHKYGALFVSEDNLRKICPDLNGRYYKEGYLLDYNADALADFIWNDPDLVEIRRGVEGRDGLAHRIFPDSD